MLILQTMGNKAIEDEMHFLVSCPMYKELRDNFLPPQIIQNNALNEEEKFVQTMTKCDTKITAKFVYQAFEDREINLDALNAINDIIESVGKIPLCNDKSRPYTITKLGKVGTKFKICKTSNY